MSEASESGSREQDEFFGTTDWMDGNGRRWTLWRGLVVECPSCGFTFGADHTNAMDENDPDGYSCPLCDLTARHIQAQDAEAALREICAMANEWDMAHNTLAKAAVTVALAALSTADSGGLQSLPVSAARPVPEEAQ